MQFKEYILSEAFIKEKFDNLPREWKDLYTESNYKIHTFKALKSYTDLNELEEYIKNKDDILISLGSNSIMLIKGGYLYAKKEIDLSDYSKIPQFKYREATYTITRTKTPVDESDVVRIVSTIIEKIVADCFDFGQQLTLDQCIKLLSLSYKEIIDDEDNTTSKSTKSSSAKKSSKNENKSSHVDPYVQSYMNKQVIPKLNEIKKSIPTIEKLESALIDIQDGKANPVKIQNILNRINDLKDILENFK